MCYAIPGKVLAVDDHVVTLDYFGEQRKARNDLFTITRGEYVYAQGGFGIQKVPATLESWRELFFKLKEIDTRLAQTQGTRAQRANAIRQRHHGNSCCIHGIIEFSNHCRRNCLYCGIRKDNAALTRYRMSLEEILTAVRVAVREHGFKALVLQSGEDDWYDEEKLAYLVEKIQKDSPCLLTLSIGERDPAVYRALYAKGARGVLLRFETSNETLYRKMKPGRSLEERLALIRQLREDGYLIMTGFLLGLPGQSRDDIMRDIDLTASLGAEMFSFGPLIPHPHTPLADVALSKTEDVLDVVAEARIRNPEAKILVTTAFETLEKNNALELGLLSGANSLMINVTPREYRALYDIYPARSGVHKTTDEMIRSAVTLLQSIGRAPTDLGL